MSAHRAPLRPTARALLDLTHAGLPTGVQLQGYETRDPTILVFSVEQLSTDRSRSSRAAVHVADSAVRTQGIQPPVRLALQLLTDVALKRAMALVRVDEPAPLLAVITAEGAHRFDPPRWRLLQDD